MGEHRFNQVAIANQTPQRQVPTFDLGDSICLIDITPTWAFKDGKVVLAWAAYGGRRSDLVPMTVRRVILGETELCDVAGLKDMLTASADKDDSAA